jgi:hypothetical protein
MILLVGDARFEVVDEEAHSRDAFGFVKLRHKGDIYAAPIPTMGGRLTVRPVDDESSRFMVGWREKVLDTATSIPVTIPVMTSSGTVDVPGVVADPFPAFRYKMAGTTGDEEFDGLWPASMTLIYYDRRRPVTVRSN